MRRTVIAVLVVVTAWPAVALAAPVLSKDRPISVGERVITLDELEHWARIAARQSGDRRTRPEHFELGADLLIGNAWLEGEAELQGIRVSDAHVERDLRRQIREAFPDGGFRRYLRQTGQTRADVEQRVKIDLLLRGIRRRVIGDAKTPRGQQRRLDRFVTEFSARWRAQTLCTPRFLSLRDRCGNAPAPE